MIDKESSKAFKQGISGDDTRFAERMGIHTGRLFSLVRAWRHTTTSPGAGTFKRAGLFLKDKNGKVYVNPATALEKEAMLITSEPEAVKS